MHSQVQLLSYLFSCILAFDIKILLVDEGEPDNGAAGGKQEASGSEPGRQQGGELHTQAGVGGAGHPPQ